MITEYSLETVYDAEIAPLMSQIIDICKQHDLPMIASFAYANDGENGHDLCTTYVAGPNSHRIPSRFQIMLAVATYSTERV